ncbi:SusC/RagA family TonB-linked outer membrane protein [Sphingobacterium faecium]|uniref:SusC/RagA family TonB-linked outer membrane protein n=1 Tax=Sphingobacterium faecium TaxID=34087 RepID=UPI00247969ED|nr:SusC/RagA family TonB-linked outer membrane protein [Sphingobacterium faecium]WGQ16707.1 SusC/RagA family TonB-linked outer membrane protein [Sphingobacterium faecium]
MKSVYSIIVLMLTLLTNLSMAQKNNSSEYGSVRDQESSEILIGVTFRAKGGLFLAKSDIKGQIALSLFKNVDSLVVSFVGYKGRTIATDYFKKSNELFLERLDQYLEEAVVNTGYQSLKSNELTGSVDVVSNKMLNQQTGTNILQRLRNIVPAFRYDNKPVQNSDLNKLNISVRGLSTINGSLDPLIVLDGFIYEGNMDNIDPNSIEQISILKDAAASSIWGARAGNGVIVITTKKGASRDGSTRTTFNSTFSIENKPDYQSLYTVDNSTFMDIEKMLYQNGYYKNALNTTKYIAVTPYVDLLDKRSRGLITESDSLRWTDYYKRQNGTQHYSNSFVSNPIVQQYALNVNGGNQLYSYGFGLGYTHKSTELEALNKKLNVQMNNSFRPTDRLQVDVSLLLTDQHSESGKPALSTLSYNSKTVPYLSFYGPDGEEVPLEKEYRKLFLDQNYHKGYLDWSYYPLSDYKHTTSNAKLRELFSTLAIRYRLSSFLTLNLTGQYQNQRIDKRNLDDEQSYLARRAINQYSEVNQQTGTVKYNVPVGGILGNNTSNGTSYTLRSQLNVNKIIKKHRIVGVIGTEIRENKIEGNASTSYGYYDDPLMSNPVDYVTRFKIVPTNTSRTITGVPTYAYSNNRFVSAYANFSYTWQDRYGLSGSFRKDGANVFGASTNDKWSPLWSTGIFWDLSKEQFFKHINHTVDQLKLRTTYGTSGNVDLRKTRDPVGTVAVDPYTRFPTVVIASLNDPSLRWEKIATFNVGIDFALFNRRINGSMDWYLKTGKDLYGLTDYDYTAWGYQRTITKNVASMQGKGLDLSLNTLNIDRTVKWSSRVLLSINKNKTTKYFNANGNSLLNLMTDGSEITPMVDYPLNGLGGFKWMGLDAEGRGQGLLDGIASTNYSAIRNSISLRPEDNNSIVFVGSAKPQLFGNIINTVSWKNMEISFNMSYMGDYYFRKPVTSYASLFQRGQAYPDFEHRWKQVGDEQRTHVPKLNYPVLSGSDSFYQGADINILKADHLRLEYISLGWNREINIKSRKSKMMLYFNASNLGVLWTSNQLGIDPEFPYKLSPQAVYSIGLKVDY